MADLLFPPHACISAQRVDVVSNTASARSIFTGATRTVDRGGDRFRWSITRSNASDRDGYAERAILKAFLAQARGQASRIWFADPAYQQRGSFPAQELISNNTFSNGTTGWGRSNTNIQLSESDRVLRVTRLNVVAASTVRVGAVTTVANAPYVFRLMVNPGRGAIVNNIRIGSSSGSNDISTTSNFSTAGLYFVVGVPWATDAYPNIADDVFGKIPGDYVEIPFASFSRCALIDNGPNMLLRSDELDNASWTKTRSSVTANATTAPDGTSTADSILEDSTSSSTHFVSQGATVASSAADYAFSVALKAGTRSWAALQMTEMTGSANATSYFDLSTGSLGASSTGTNWANIRSFISPLGDGWYLCSVVARKTNAATGMSLRIYLSNGNSGATYTGDGSSNIYAWRATLAQSSVPTRLAKTSAAAVTGSSQTGTGLYIKGLPASTNGLLLAGDRVQIGTQLCEVVAPLNSDASGLGYLQLAWPLRTPPADNAPVIINNPMARCILTSNEGGWSDIPGGFSEFDFQLEEALDQ